MHQMGLLPFTQTSTGTRNSLNKNLMNFNKGKHQVLHLTGVTPCTSSGWRQSGWKTASGSIFTVPAIKHWTRVLSEAVECPSLERFRTQLDRAGSYLLELIPALNTDFAVDDLQSSIPTLTILCFSLTRDSGWHCHKLSQSYPGLHPNPSKLRVGILLLYSTLMRSHLEYCAQLWGTKHSKDMGQLEGLFRRVCRDRIRGHGFQLKEGRVRFNVRSKFFT